MQINITKSNIIPIDIADERYPKEWKLLPDAPQTVYAIGDLSLLKERKFTVVGSRRTPAAALKTGTNIAKDLSKAFAIVTGTADGGDGAAIEGALQGSGKVICLLAGGFSSVPQGNLALLERVASRGVLLSVHSYDTAVRAFSYEYRNKLLASLGEGTLVLGAAEKSGALITAKYAESFEKPIFALPYFPGSAAGAGCNALLKKGGVLTENAADVFGYFGICPTEKTSTVNLSQDERKVLQMLRELSEAHSAELSEKTGVPVFKLRALLSSLEIKGLVVSLGGNRYAPLGE